MKDKKNLWKQDNAFRKGFGVKFPKSYPDETLVKLCSSKVYSKLTKVLFDQDKKIKACDIGCMSGNNLRLFIELGYKAYGVDINDHMTNLAKKNLKRLNYKIPTIKKGNNLSIPFKKNTFDLLTSFGTLHYSYDEYTHKAINEFKRVLKKRGIAIIETTGNKHEARKKSKKNKELNWTWGYDDFRKGQIMGWFDDENHFKKVLHKHFSKVEIIVKNEISKEANFESYTAICSV